MDQFAIVGLGGKQVRVQAGDVIETEKIAGEAGAKVKLNRVFLTEEKIGTPLLEEAFVTGEIMETKKAAKVRVFKMKPRKRMRKDKGHRQLKTKLKILEIKT